MLSVQDNELLTRVGPGTPMGELMRQYWIPALPSSEFPEPDSPPKRMRLLGENLVMFRDSSGRVGCIAESCPHRDRIRHVTVILPKGADWVAETEALRDSDAGQPVAWEMAPLRQPELELAPEAGA